MSLMSPARAGGFFTTSATWDAPASTYLFPTLCLCWWVLFLPIVFPPARSKLCPFFKSKIKACPPPWSLQGLLGLHNLSLHNKSSTYYQVPTMLLCVRNSYNPHRYSHCPQATLSPVWETSTEQVDTQINIIYSCDPGHKRKTESKSTKTCKQGALILLECQVSGVGIYNYT